MHASEELTVHPTVTGRYNYAASCSACEHTVYGTATENPHETGETFLDTHLKFHDPVTPPHDPADLTCPKCTDTVGSIQLRNDARYVCTTCNTAWNLVGFEVEATE